MNKCIFCNIAEGIIPSIRIYEDVDFIAMMDINPVTSGHCLLITKNHYATTSEVPEDILAKALPLAKKVAKAVLLGVGANGYNLLQNNGAVAGQLIEHWHIHIIPRKKPDELPLKQGDPADLTQLPFIASSIRDNI